MKKSLSIPSLDDVDILIEEIDKLLSDYQIFCFHGDLGAGKTTYIKQIVKYLGVQDHTSSPSFSIVNEYQTEGGKSIFHFDLYRLNKPQELIDIGWEDYLSSNALIFIEWPEMAQGLIPEDAIHIFITDNQPERTLIISDSNERPV